jgi:hypothetical protein
MKEMSAKAAEIFIANLDYLFTSVVCPLHVIDKRITYYRYLNPISRIVGMWIFPVCTAYLLT